VEGASVAEGWAGWAPASTETVIANRQAIESARAN
jgi:hypothetical protein